MFLEHRSKPLRRVYNSHLSGKITRFRTPGSHSWQDFHQGNLPLVPVLISLPSDKKQLKQATELLNSTQIPWRGARPVSPLPVPGQRDKAQTFGLRDLLSCPSRPARQAHHETDVM